MSPPEIPDPETSEKSPSVEDETWGAYFSMAMDEAFEKYLATRNVQDSTKGQWRSMYNGFKPALIAALQYDIYDAGWQNGFGSAMWELCRADKGESDEFWDWEGVPTTNVDPRYCVDAPEDPPRISDQEREKIKNLLAHLSIALHLGKEVAG